MIQGILKADGLALMEITDVSFLAGSANPKMRAKAAYVSSASGATLGYVQHENWSKETLQRLAELRQSMEHDLADLYFVSSSSSRPSEHRAPTGLLDHLQAGEAPSV
jgi:hypothetical protein